MRSFDARDRSTGSDRGGSEFHSIVFGLQYGSDDDPFPGQLLFEQLEDGSWAYRCDEMTRIFALSAYRLGILAAEQGATHMSGGHPDGDPFCVALQARPDVVIPLASKERLSPRVRAVFDDALRDEHCYTEDGFRLEHRPNYATPRDLIP